MTTYNHNMSSDKSPDVDDNGKTFERIATMKITLFELQCDVAHFINDPMHEYDSDFYTTSACTTDEISKLRVELIKLMKNNNEFANVLMDGLLSDIDALTAIHHDVVQYRTDCARLKYTKKEMRRLNNKVYTLQSNIDTYNSKLPRVRRCTIL